MNSYDFDDQVAVITGGAQGIGYAVAKRMIENGAKVVIWDFDTDLAQASASELGATALHCDVSDWDIDWSAGDEAIEQLGQDAEHLSGQIEQLWGVDEVTRTP